MKIVKQILMLLVVFGCWVNTCLAEDVLISIKSDPSSPMVGQKVTLTLDVLARDAWATIDTLPLLEVPGAYLHRYETQGTRLNENISGVSYSGQRYEILLFAHRAGELIIDPFNVEVLVKTWGADAVTKSHTLSTEPLMLAVSTPEGVSSHDYLPVTTKLDAKQSWSPELKEYQTGDAIERKMTRRADDVSAMVFPPLDLPKIDGMSCYPSQPEVNDSFNRGILEGLRVDAMSCILEKPGQFSFPEITVSYWNTAEKKVVDVVLPGISFSVTGSGQMTSAGGVVPVSKTSRMGLFLTITVIVLCFLFYVTRGTLLEYIKTQRVIKLASEKYLFQQVQKNLSNGSQNEVLAAVMHWLDSLPEMQQPARLDEFIRRSGAEDLVSIAVIVGQEQTWSEEQRRTLSATLEKGRKSYLNKHVKKVAAAKDLPPVGLHS